MISREIRQTLTINAPVEKVWEAWTTESGIQSFFARNCHVEARIGGPLECYFDMEKPAGERGSEGCVFLALQPNRLISFTWNAPPHLPAVRAQRTHVAIYLKALSEVKTELEFVNAGYGAGGEWDAAFDYFHHAWLDMVLPNLKKMLESQAG
ncbi:MAG: SRPBCC domain-containing protein [Lentisphaeria bacterium]|nr:SRPBCC domain-containing protein [Candidatus Neomarinimicrobiota bacterium]MCF7842728.1 SRPBCC domain-containing protein [Lentisphaeria bacterium]